MSEELLPHDTLRDKLGALLDHNDIMIDCVVHAVKEAGYSKPQAQVEEIEEILSKMEDECYEKSGFKGTRRILSRGYAKAIVDYLKEKK